VSLSPRTRVGRSPENDLVVAQSLVSGFHAVLEWAAGTWIVRDLGSSNGTFVDNAMIAAGEPRAVAEGARMAFGDPESLWCLRDASRPQAEALDLETGERLVAEYQILALGRREAQVVLLEGSPGAWVLESDGATVPARNGQEVDVEGRRLRLLLPVGLPATEQRQTGGPTAPPKPLGGAWLHLTVSKDLETFELTVEHDGQSWTSERTYVRVLVALASARLSERERGDLHTDECGWVYSDRLCDLAELTDEVRLNIEVHRARRDLAKHGMPNAAMVIQRRRGTKQLRIGTDHVSLVELGRR